MRDLDIRLALRRQMHVQHAGDPDTRILEELPLCLGIARVDVAVVNGSIHGFEIKSEHDTLVRLSGQSEVYGRALDRVTLVAAEHHAEKAARQVPEWWGIVIATGVRQDGCKLLPHREAADNPAPEPLAIAQLLWREEALSVLEERGLADGLRSKPRRALWQRLAEELPFDELRAVVRVRVKHRPADWLVGALPT